MISKITGQEVNFGIDFVEKIIGTFPMLNLNWLLTGIGEMYNSSGEISGGEKTGEKVKRNAGVFTKTENVQDNGIVQKMLQLYSRIDETELNMLVAAFKGIKLSEVGSLSEADIVFYAEPLLLGENEAEKEMDGLLSQIGFCLFLSGLMFQIVEETGLKDFEKNRLRGHLQEGMGLSKWIRGVMGYRSKRDWDWESLLDSYHYKTKNKRVNRALTLLLLRDEVKNGKRELLFAAAEFTSTVNDYSMAAGDKMAKQK